MDLHLTVSAVYSIRFTKLTVNPDIWKGSYIALKASGKRINRIKNMNDKMSEQVINKPQEKQRANSKIIPLYVVNIHHGFQTDFPV